MQSRFTRAFIVVLLTSVAVVLFDVVAWFAVAPEHTGFAVSYRQALLPAGQGAGRPALTRDYARDYFVADAELGFDLRPGARMIDKADGIAYEIFANDLGCFDRNSLASLKDSREYHYFAGDSFTWGFTEYDSKFATVWEKLTGKVAAKCGVTHTGQAHQFDKFKRVAAAVGKFPATVFVGFYVNDPVNDAGHPHTSVFGGYMADVVFLKEGQLVRPDPERVRRVVEESIRALEAPRPVPSVLQSAKTWVWVHSLSANIVDAMLIGARKALQGAARPAGPASQGPTSEFGDNLYWWYDVPTMKTRYADDPKTAANRSAIRAWAQHARENRYRLVMLLIPAKSDFNDPQFYAQVRGWMDSQGVEHLDLATLFKEGGYKVSDLYWKNDGHWNPEGNRVVGQLLAKRFP